VLFRSGGGGGDAMSQDEFCAKAAQLDSMGDITPETLEIYGDLTDGAPTAELRDAMKTLLPAIRRFATVDVNDIEAFEEVMNELNTAENIAANEVLSEYLDGTCMLGADETDPADDGSGEGDSSGELDAYNDIDFDALLATTDELIPAYYAEGVRSTGISQSGLFPGAEIILPFDTEGDGLSLCSALLDWVNTQTLDPNVVIRIQLNGSDTVVREAGGDCAEI